MAESDDGQNAVISEGLRHMHGVTTRLPRVAHEPIQYKEWVIPENVSFITIWQLPSADDSDADTRQPIQLVRAHGSEGVS